MTRSRWTRQNPDSSSASDRLFEEGLPVRLIATPRADFKTCHADESLADVLARNHERFDYFPVTETGGGRRIVGLVDLTAFHQGKRPAGHVRDSVTPLTEENLIGADAGIITFVKNADRQGCCLVVAGAEISGLVSLSDLQKLPVRAALFGMITHLEIVMANAIRRVFDHPDGWLGKLSGERQKMINDKFGESQKKNTDVERLLFAQFKDKVCIIMKSGQFAESKTSFIKEMRRIGKLRDDVAHANDYAPTPEAAKDVCDVVRSMEQRIHWLDSWQRPKEPDKRT